MTHLIRLLAVIGFASVFSIAHAGEITDTYTTGDTLTATTLDNIKSAVNDNDSNVTTNTTAIANMFSGDGSAGPLTISANTDWTNNPPANDNYNFTDCTIEALTTLQVPPGTTIRCSGNFINEGNIVVLSKIASASQTTWGGPVGASAEFYSTGHPGDTIQAASGGSYDHDGATDAQILRGGYGGTAIPRTTAASSFKGFRFGGGSGGGFGGSGQAGGLLKIFAGGSITNNSSISASGFVHCCQGGGGGGGIIVLAAQSSVTNSATGIIEANGGAGANSRSFGGAGGGGGGGIVIFVAPTIDNSGAVNVLGGAAGTNVTNVTVNARLGGGGASGGDGGNGGGVSGATTGIPSAAQDGGDRYLLEINANPAFM